MSCSFEPDVLRLDDGELSTERRFLIEAHLAVCPSCARIEETLDLVEQTLRAAPETPLGIIGPTLAALPPRKRYGMRVTIAAVSSGRASPTAALSRGSRPRPGMPISSVKARPSDPHTVAAATVTPGKCPVGAPVRTPISGSTIRLC